MLTCLIADDEAPARARLRRLLQPFEDAGRVRVAGEAGDGVEALALLEEAPVDLAFLDVKMPGLDGFGVLERVSPAHRPDVVFTTAYHDFALRAFEENAVDYLLKPVARERLEQSLDRAEARAAARRRAPGPPARLARRPVALGATRPPHRAAASALGAPPRPPRHPPRRGRREH
jgi:DNA-binding LytR/AlgR family response regulator